MRWWRRGWPILLLAGVLMVWAASQTRPIDGAEPGAVPSPPGAVRPAPPPGVEGGSLVLSRTAEMLGPRLAALDPIERAVALREWETTLAVPVRWGAGPDWAAISDAQRPRLLAGYPVELEGPRRVVLLVARDGKAAGDGDLLVVGPWIRTPSAAAATDANPSAALALAPGPSWPMSAWWLLGVGVVVGGGLTAVIGSMRRARRREVAAPEAPRPLSGGQPQRLALPPPATAPAFPVFGDSTPAPQPRRGLPVGAAMPPLDAFFAPTGIDRPAGARLSGAAERRADSQGSGSTPDAVPAPTPPGPVMSPAASVTVPATDAHAALLPHDGRSRAEAGDLAALLRHEVERLRHQTHDGRDLSDSARDSGWGAGPLAIDFDPWLEGPVAHQPALMRRAVRQLLRAAAERAQRHVVLSARIDSERVVVIEVDDDGPWPGNAAEAADGSRHATGDAVIDQAFVNSVAQWHGGRTAVERSPLGGTRCLLEWPLARGEFAEGPPSPASPITDTGVDASAAASHERRLSRDRRRDDRRG